jgi:hypothetical protein
MAARPIVGKPVDLRTGETMLWGHTATPLTNEVQCDVPWKRTALGSLVSSRNFFDNEELLKRRAFTYSLNPKNNG